MPKKQYPTEPLQKRSVESYSSSMSLTDVLLGDKSHPILGSALWLGGGALKLTGWMLGGTAKNTYKLGKGILRTKIGQKALVASLAIGGPIAYYKNTEGPDSSNARPSSVEVPAYVAATGQASGEIIPSNAIAEQMMQDVEDYTVIDFGYALSQAKHVSNNHIGAQISMKDVVRYMYNGGFRGKRLKIAAAIAMRESGGYPDNLGDVGYRGANRVSVGLVQMSFGADGLEGVGERNPYDNMDPEKAARNMYILWEKSYDPNEPIEDAMEYTNGFEPWDYRQAHSDNPDPAQYVYFEQVEDIYDEFTQLYGDLTTP